MCAPGVQTQVTGEQVGIVRRIKRLAVVGARGQMGGLFVNRCSQAGLDVAQVNRPFADQDLVPALAQAQLIMFSVPASAFDAVLARVLPFADPGAIVCDNVSVKVLPVNAMLQAWGGPVVGTHPLFGPEPGKEDRAVAVVPGRDEAACLAVEQWLLELEFSPFRCTAEEHDLAMAQIQGLNFATTVAYLAALSRQDELLRFLTPSFRRRLQAAEKMLREDADLFSTLFEANPYSQEAVRRYRNYLQAAASGDVEILVERGRWWWESHGPDDA